MKKFQPVAHGQPLPNPLSAKTNAPQYKAYWLCGFKKDKDGEMTPSLETVLKTLELIQADVLSSNIAIPEPFIEAIGK